MLENFFGRTTYSELLTKRISGLCEGYRQNIAIVGDELVGKTTLIHSLLERSCDNRMILLYVETRPELLGSFAKRFCGILLYNFLSNSGQELKEDIGFLLVKSEKYIPKTVQKIRLILAQAEKGKKAGLFTDLLSLADLLYSETQKHCVVIFDEFHNLENFGINSLYREWAKLLIAQKNVMYIIISSQKYKTKTILSKDLSLLFGNFEVVAVEPFNIRTAEAFIEKRLGTESLHKGLRDFLVHFTGGNPFYLNVILDSLLKSSGAKLAHILEGLLFDSSGILNQRFSSHMKRFHDLTGSKDYISILYLVASGRNRIKDISQLLKKPAKQVLARINKLLEMDALTRSADFLKVNDRVFGFWLRFVHQEKMQSLTFDSRAQKDKFRNLIEEMISEFLLSADKSILERVSELLKLFENDTIQLERKKIRLDHFREIKPLEFGGVCLKKGLLGRSNKTTWVLAVKPEPLTEEDISEFSRECKKYQQKLQHKIIVTLQDTDTNTRLKAMEEKIWTWDINSLNQMLDLFSRPRVIA